MARTTRAKKQAEAPKVNIGTEIFESLRDLEKLKGIPVDYMVERLKQALVNAYRRDREDHRVLPADNVVVNLNEDGLTMFQVKTAMAEPEDWALEIPIDAARNYKPDAQEGDAIYIPVDIAKFGRIAAQTAKQVVIQGIREAERGVMFESYSSKSQELLSGTVSRVMPATGDIIVKIGQGDDASEALLPASEQIPGEHFTEGDHIQVYVMEVRKPTRGPLIHVSRTHPNLIRRLFELETPEIADGQVEIHNIAREAGSRSKMAVRATMEGIDPVGACVGPRGGRVAAVVEALHGEKIEIVVWSEDPCEYVKAALSPANVLSVSLVPGQKACSVVVPDDQLSLAIGKEGQNARLAARLTGYKIDIKPASQVAAQEEPAEAAEEKQEQEQEQEPAEAEAPAAAEQKTYNDDAINLDELFGSQN